MCIRDSVGVVEDRFVEAEGADGVLFVIQPVGFAVEHCAPEGGIGLFIEEQDVVLVVNPPVFGGAFVAHADKQAQHIGFTTRGEDQQEGADEDQL